MKRTLQGVFSVVMATSFCAVPSVAQYGASGMETAAAVREEGAKAEAARKSLYERYGTSPLYEVMVQSTAQGCPVGMEAKRLGGGALLNAGKGEKPGPGQRIRLTLHDRTNPAKVVEARVAVRGTDGKPRMSTLASGVSSGLASGLASSTNRAGEVTKTVTLNFSDRGESWAAADMILRGLTSVSRVRLESLTYADGTIWQPEKGSACAVVPSPLMLVAGR